MFSWATFIPKDTDETLQGAQVLKDKQGLIQRMTVGKVEQVEVTSWRMRSAHGECHVTLALSSRGDGDKCGVCKGSAGGS